MRINGRFSKASAVAFATESSRIEREEMDPQEPILLRDFVNSPSPDADELLCLAQAASPTAKFRINEGHVYSPKGIAPGGPRMPLRLDMLLSGMSEDHPYDLHHYYETLHPFTDGNGRSGRALWLWGMVRRSEEDRDMALTFGFLQTWYYQSLARKRAQETL